MKKSTKLLSVILAVLMIFSSLSVASFAARTNYKTVDNLKALSAYSPYGSVTRLTTEERMSILFDQLDILLGELNINMGTIDLSILGKIEIDLRSINALCKTVDSVQTLVNKNSGLLWMAKVINYIDVSTWQSGMTRENTSQFTIVSELFEFISANELLVNRILVEGLQFGVANSFLPFDREGISSLIQNLPSTIKTLIFPLMARPDATASELSIFTNTAGNGGVLSVLDKIIPELFSKPMLWTSYRVNANGDDLKYTAELPTAAGQTSRYFVVENGGEQISQYDYNFPVLLGSKDNVGKWTKTVTYTKTLETEGGDTYVYAAPAGYSGDQTLKWYKNGDKGYLLPSVRDAINSGALSFSVNGADSALGLLYKFIPYVFAEMAPVVLNGSVKKLLAGALGVSFTEMTAAEVNAVKGLAAAGDFFTKPQEFYLWEYSDYKVIDGVPYYRFEDTYFKGTLPENLSTYYYMFNWDWKITDDFVNEFIPTVDGTTIGASVAGYDTILDGLNAFVYKVINTVLVENFEVKGQTYNLRTGLGWVNGGLDKVVDNVLRAARYAFSIAPEEIFDEYYSDAKLSPYYNMMMNGTVKQALTGLACAGIKLLMPQAQLPTEAKLCKTVGTDSADDVSVLALGSVVLRELCTQFMPQYNFDALIYADYSTKTILTGADYDANYWLDTALNIGMDFGMYYLRSLTDLGEDDDAGYYSVMSNLKAIPSNTPTALVYKAGGTYVVESGKKIPAWQYKLDWVLDWGLSSAKDWTWKFEKYIDCGATVDLATYQDPWAKLNTIILKILPLDQLLDGTGVTTASNTWLENILRGKLVNGISTLNLPLVASAFKIPNGLLRNANVLTQAVTLVKGLLNSVLYKLAGNYDIIPAEVKTVDDLFNQDTLVKTLAGTTTKSGSWYKHASDGFIAKLKVIVTNGLLDPLLPIVGLFLGWKSGAQDFNDPSIYFVTSKNDTYLHSAATNTLKIANKSSGMLEKHRNSDAVDNPYVLTINSIEVDEGVALSGSFPQTLNPGETIEMNVTVPAGKESVATFKVNYSIAGKDGKAIGSEQTKVIYARLTSTWDEENNMVSNGKEDNGIFSSQHKEYTFTKDLFTTVTTLTGEAQNSSSKAKNFARIYADSSPAMSENFMQYFESQTNREEAEWPEKIDAYANKTNGTASGKLYKAKAGVTSATEIPYGYYDGGQIAVQYEWMKTITIKGTAWAIWDYDFVYYNDYDIENVAKSYINKNLKASDFGADAQADFAAYETALKQVKFLADAPKTTMYTDDITIEDGGVMVHIPAAIAALDSAYEKLMKNPIVGDVADVNTISDAIDAIAESKGYEIDYENYELYEFFAYDKAVKAGYKMIDSTKGPAKPENYIEGENLSQAVIEAIAANKGGNIKTGIDATVSAPSEEAMTKYNDALANFTAPVYSTVQVEDTIARIKYYFGFMDANMKTPVVKDFLNQEISIAEAQNYVQGDYSADSWAAYTKALADAKAVQADVNARQSQIFDAKYELMKAQNELLPKYASMKDNGYLDGELATLIEQANTVVGHFNEYFKVKDGVDATEAWKQLVQALGVEYNVNVGGTDYTGILYNHSALTFTAYDRLNSNKEKAKVDAACDKLQAALNNFVSSVTLDKNNSGVVNQVTQDVRYIQGIVPGTVTTAEAILNNVKASNPAAKLAVTPSKSNGFGTGATVKVSVDGIGVLSTYYVVIYGDVNGDGVVDAFDAFAVDKNVNSLAALDGVYAKAADADASGEISVADLTPIMSASVGNADVISQTR